MNRDSQAAGSGGRISRTPVLLSWSGGKDSALALARLRRDSKLDVVGLLTTVTTGHERISIHGVRRTLLHRQAEALQLPVCEIEIPQRSSNEAYEAAWEQSLHRLPPAMRRARSIAFGDIFLADVRQYREILVGRLGFSSIFPLWGESTGLLASEVISSGFAVRIVCIDTRAIPAGLAGSAYDEAFLHQLPDTVDPCGERGEFHTFVSAGPEFRTPVAYEVGDTVMREDRFAYCDLIPAHVAL